jgi:hypothetical protein
MKGTGGQMVPTRGGADGGTTPPQGRGAPSQLCLGVKSFYALPKRIAAADATYREREELDRSPPPVTTIVNRFQTLKSTVASPQLCRYIDVVKSKHGSYLIFPINF